MINERIMELQNQQIKGVTLKLMYTIVISTVFVTSSVICTYFALIGRIDRMEAKAENRDTKNDGTHEAIFFRLTALENKK